MTATATRAEAGRAEGVPDAPPRRRPILAGTLLALLTPALIWLANPPLTLWPLILVAFVPMLVAQHHVLPARWSPLAVAIGFGGSWAAYFSWGLAGGEVALVYQLLPLYMGVIAAGLAWRSRRFQARTGYRWFVVTFPLVWTAIEFLRSSGSETLGGTWGFQTYALYDHPALLQPIAVTGVLGLQLLIVLVNFAVAGLVLARLSGDGRQRTWARRSAAVVAALAVVWVASSLVMIDEAPGTLRVAAVQTGVYDNDSWRERLARDVEQTRRAAAEGAKLIVWNEGGLRTNAHVGEVRQILQALARETGAYLAVGYRYDISGGKHANEVTLVSPEGAFLGKYGKDHPGEFAGDYSDTQGTFPVYETEIGEIATIICYDLDYTDTARKMTRGGAQVIATPSADLEPIARTHYTHLVFRSIENRVSTVKADNAFDSAIIDPWGRIIKKAVTPTEGRATLIADVPLGSGKSPWVTFGDWLGWLLVAGAGAFTVWCVVLRLRARSGAPPN